MGFRVRRKAGEGIARLGGSERLGGEEPNLSVPISERGVEGRTEAGWKGLPKDLQVADADTGIRIAAGVGLECGEQRAGTGTGTGFACRLDQAAHHPHHALLAERPIRQRGDDLPAIEEDLAAGRREGCQRGAHGLAQDRCRDVASALGDQLLVEVPVPSEDSGRRSVVAGPKEETAGKVADGRVDAGRAS
ncbi:MAG: hypothetical protein QM765_42540 [Myxococcales bacterium]